MSIKLRWIAVPLAFVGASAMAGLSVMILRGVHFHANAEEVDFGIPPPREAAGSYSPYYENPHWRPGTLYRDGDFSDRWSGPEGEYEAKQRRHAANEAGAYARARNAELRGDYARALATYRTMDRQNQGDRGYVRSRIDLLTEVRDPATEGLAAYLKATPGQGKAPTALPKRTGTVLQPFIAYERALASPRKVADLLAVADRYPQSAKAPAALMMAGRAITQGKRPVPPAALQVAETAFRRVRIHYPRSRFAWDAQGGLGRVAFLRRRYPEAMRHYRLQLEGAKGERAVNALSSLAMCERVLNRRDRLAETYLRLMPYDRTAMVFYFRACTAQFSARDARNFGRRLRQDRALLTAYLDYRADFTTPTRDLFALEPHAGFSGHALSRLASSALFLKDAPRARRLSQSALTRKPEGDSHALATFVLATLDRRAGRPRAARDRYASLVRRWPKSYLVGGARENLALMEEKLGNLPGALDQYTALAYDEDVAYLIDARMTPRQLSQYIRTRPHHPRRLALVYTLGMRHLRKGDWDAAERTLRSLTPAQRKRLGHVSPDTVAVDGKVPDPLRTVRTLRHLDRKVRTARGRTARAEALYALGGYYYHGGNLLLYSPPAWKEWRSTALGFSWNDGVALPDDDRALRTHHEEHEALAHALRHFRRIVRDYGDTPTAPKAAYWGACAAERLSRFAPYWRWQERRADLLGESVRLMRLAEQSKDPKLAARARKYHGVFRDLYTGRRSAFAEEKAPPRRYRSDTQDMWGF
ncbi:MAG: hypothetical protein ACO1SV_20545 [Fimbriimonas sp.]